MDMCDTIEVGYGGLITAEFDGKLLKSRCSYGTKILT